MAKLTVGEFLDKNLAFKNRLTSFYAEIRDQTQDNAIRLLTYHLAKGKTRQAVALENLPPETIHQARKVQIALDEPFNPKKKHRLPDFEPATVNGNDLIGEAIARQGKLASQYRFILAQTRHEDVRAVLTALVLMEERDIELLKKMLAMRYFDR